SQSGCIIFHGESPAPIKLSGTVSKGDAVGYSDGWKRALAAVDSVVQMRCVASEDGVTDQVITAYFGLCEMGGRFSGGTEGNAIYVAEGTDSGEYIDEAPADVGDANKIVGYTMTALRITVHPNMNDDSLATA
ncbi:unnamed protein product, partial [marine sediment metagenome]